MYRSFTKSYFAGCWLALLGICGVAVAQRTGHMPMVFDFGTYWIVVALFWVATAGFGQLVMVPHMRFVRDNYPALWKEFHYVPGITEWAEQHFHKDSLMLQKYNSFAMFKYAFSRRDHDNPDLRLIKSFLRASVLYPGVFFVILPLLGFLYAI